MVLLEQLLSLPSHPIKEELVLVDGVMNLARQQDKLGLVFVDIEGSTLKSSPTDAHKLQRQICFVLYIPQNGSFEKKILFYIGKNSGYQLHSNGKTVSPQNLSNLIAFFQENFVLCGFNVLYDAEIMEYEFLNKNAHYQGKQFSALFDVQDYFEKTFMSKQNLEKACELMGLFYTRPSYGDLGNHSGHNAHSDIINTIHLASRINSDYPDVPLTLSNRKKKESNKDISYLKNMIASTKLEENMKLNPRFNNLTNKEKKEKMLSKLLTYMLEYKKYPGIRGFQEYTGESNLREIGIPLYALFLTPPELFKFKKQGGDIEGQPHLSMLIKFAQAIRLEPFFKIAHQIDQQFGDIDDASILAEKIQARFSLTENPFKESQSFKNYTNNPEGQTTLRQDALKQESWVQAGAYLFLKTIHKLKK